MAAREPRDNRPEIIMRRSMIIGYHEAGKSINEISHLMGLSKPTVRMWIRRFEEGHVETRPRSGRPRKITPQQDAMLVNAARRAPQSTAVSLTSELQLPCHPSMSRRHLHEAGVHCYVPAVKEVLNDVMKESRLRFAQHYSNFGMDFWNTKIFTDEKCFTSVEGTRRHCWRVTNTRYDPQNIHKKVEVGGSVFHFMAGCGQRDQES
ncbi:hypothetical protein Pcinc_019549 [Petrolisthes cinctipes]|uniref:Transposase Tc1-like domain-containing protein n=1 Tax=Petrolisthes cinctipes TaxID=88211 RepID=A0AAE1KMJ3_PETCI|nr:hypothetical protein Pcinc_019549 [Petrolisthes cinctipes]